MVLLHGGSPKGAERIAARWADHRKVPQIAFKPDWTKHAKAAPFKRNDQMLDVLPIGVIVFPGTGIQENLADKARKLGIPVWKFGGTAARKRRRYRRIEQLRTCGAAISALAPRRELRRSTVRRTSCSPSPCGFQSVRDRLFLAPRRGGGGGATLATLVTGPTTMIIIGILLNIAGLGIVCWALFALAVYALPFFVGMTAGMYTFQAEQVRSAPSLLASSRVASHSWSGSIASLSHALPSSVLSSALLFAVPAASRRL